jgi:hypothetical protein
LKNSLPGDLQKTQCARMPYKRFLESPRHFLSPEFAVIL